MQIMLHSGVVALARLSVLVFLVVEQESSAVEFLSVDGQHSTYSPTTHDGVYMYEKDHGGKSVYKQVSAALSFKDASKDVAEYLDRRAFVDASLEELTYLVNKVIKADLITQAGKISTQGQMAILSLNSYIGYWHSGTYASKPQFITEVYMITIAGVPKTSLIYEFQLAPGFKKHGTPLSLIEGRFGKEQGMSEFKHESHRA